jgi:hypothetical protein
MRRRSASAFVRNPYSRALSCWLDKMVANSQNASAWRPFSVSIRQTFQAFAAFLTAVAEQPEAQRDPHWATQTHLLNPHGIRYSFIGRFEHSVTDFGRGSARISGSRTTQAISRPRGMPPGPATR